MEERKKKEVYRSRMINRQFMKEKERNKRETERARERKRGIDRDRLIKI